MTFPSVTLLSTGQQQDSGTSIGSGVAGALTVASGKLACILFASSRSDTFTHDCKITGVTASGLTFAQVFDEQVEFNVGSTYPLTNWHVQLYVAPVASTVSSLAWSTTMSDGDVNEQIAIVFTVDGLTDYTQPFDGVVAAASAVHYASTQLTAAVYSHGSVNLSTSSTNDLLMSIFLDGQKVNEGDVPPTVAAGTGQTELANVASTRTASGGNLFVQTKTSSSPVSAQAQTTGFNSEFQLNIALAFTGGTTPTVNALVTATDAEVLTSGPGSNAVATTNAAEIITSGPGSSAVVSTNAIEVLSSVAAGLHYFVSTEAAEIISSGPGSHADVTTTAVEVLSTGDGSNAIVSTNAIEVLSSTAVYVARAMDGGKIYEFSFAFKPESIYQESDYDSIWGIGDRIGNGLLTVNKSGWSSASNPGDLFNDNWGLAAGDGFGVGGSTGWPVGAFWSFQLTGNWGWVDGFKFHAGVSHSIPGWFALLSGFDGEVWALDTVDFNQFDINITAADPEGGYQMELLFTPTIIPWNYFQFTLWGDDGGANFAGGDFGTELQIRLPHSILDGGDRRSTNGRPAKRVTMSASSGINAVTGVGIDPFENLFDGKYFHSNAGTRSKTNATQFKRVGGTGGDDAINTAGEYFQFAFPRKVFMREMVWCVNDGEALDGFGEPTRMGKWQWYGSNSATTGYVALGDPFFFQPGSNWALAPKVLEETQLPPILTFGANIMYSGNSDDFSYPYFRMVLVEGYSAFGGGLNIAQIQFNVIDPAGQGPIMTIDFTDDVDGVLPVVTIGSPGSPYVVSLTDGTDDTLTATVTITPHLSLTCDFSDAEGDGLNAWGSFYPTRFSQTMVVVKGR